MFELFNGETKAGLHTASHNSARDESTEPCYYRYGESISGVT